MAQVSLAPRLYYLGSRSPFWSRSTGGSVSVARENTRSQCEVLDVIGKRIRPWHFNTRKLWCPRPWTLRSYAPTLSGKGRNWHAFFQNCQSRERHTRRATASVRALAYLGSDGALREIRKHISDEPFTSDLRQENYSYLLGWGTARLELLRHGSRPPIRR